MKVLQITDEKIEEDIWYSLKLQGVLERWLGGKQVRVDASGKFAALLYVLLAILIHTNLSISYYTYHASPGTHKVLNNKLVMIRKQFWLNRIILSASSNNVTNSLQKLQ